MSTRKSLSIRSYRRSGLVLLVVLGMLGLFSLLAISYLTISGASRSSSQSLVRAKLQNIPIGDYAESVIRQINRGTTDRNSAFAHHGLLEDIYGRNPIEGSFQVASALSNSTTTPIGIVKVQLASSVNVNPDPFRTQAQEAPNQTNSRSSFLSTQKDAYAGRLITFLEGPLQNQTYRILAYAGLPVPSIAGIDFAVAIDLSETDLSVVPVYAQGRPTGEQATLQSVIASYGIGSFFETNPGNASSIGYRYVINDIPFNGFGYGIERDSNNDDFGNLGGSRLIPDPLNLLPSSNVPVRFPPNLLPHYDYLQDRPAGTFETGTIGWLNDPTTSTLVEVIGSNNEGFDVPDYRDMWLGYVPEGSLSTIPSQPLPTTAEIVPSFHRPELVNYIVQAFEKLRVATSETYSPADLARIVQMIDYACPRPLSYRLTGVPGAPNGIVRNLDFVGRNDLHAIGTLDVDVSNTAVALPAIQRWAARLIGQGTSAQDLAFWDIDNDADGIADSVWMDPNLPLVSASDGKQLKVLAAPLILDMDGRINIYATGDAIQGNHLDPANSYQTKFAAGTESAFARAASFLPQGLGFGPAEISMASFFLTTAIPPAQRAQNIVKLFSLRYGPDGGAGRSVPLGASIDDLVGRFFQQKGLWESPINLTAHRGLQLGRRGQIAYGIDRFGNPRMTDSRFDNARTYFSTNPTNDYPECKDDPYETSPYSVSSGDSKVALEEMESILRRFDHDVSGLPDRVRNLINRDLRFTNLNDAIYSSISTLSSELRYPNMAALAKHDRDYVPTFNASTNFPRINNPGNPNQAIPAVASGTRLVSNQSIEGSMLRWVQLMHQERFPGTPPLSQADVRNLFPLEFRKGLKLDINRAFGNGVDTDGDFQIDEPQELQNAAGEMEWFPTSATTSTTTPGEYDFNYPNYPVPGTAPSAAEQTTYIDPLRSRKLLARQLYCLAQLLVTSDYPFGGVASSDSRYRARRARELAQWAINVVDFRDTDGAMTRFEYDETPFFIDTGDTDVWEPKTGRVVWGMEFPDLLLTESLAFHDTRIRDTEFDNHPTRPTSDKKIVIGDPTKDQTMDQYRIPQGSLFLELFCPRTSEIMDPSTNPNQSLGLAPSSLYTNDPATGMRLQLDTLTPVDSGNVYGRQPVFRIGISQQQASGSGPAVTLASRNQELLFAMTNQTSVYDKVNLGIANNAFNSSGLSSDLNGTATTNIEFDRIVWFTNLAGDDPVIRQVPDLLSPSGPNRDKHVFYNKANSATSMLGGDYLVIGPRQRTDIGSRVPNDPTLPVHTPSLQSIRFGASGVNVGDITTVGLNRIIPPAAIARPPLTMVAVSEPPALSWITNAQDPLFTHKGVGLNISEPLAIGGTYYPRPGFRLNNSDTTGDGTPGVQGFSLLPQDAYGSFPVATPTFPDTPFDQDPAVNPLLATTSKFKTGTYANERTAYLQRIADPELPYHPTLNPYITIDWISIDLTVFNGEDVRVTDPQDNAATVRVAFQSRYKDGARADQTPTNADIEPSLIVGRSLIGTGSSGSERTGASLFSASTGQLIQSQPISPVVIAPGTVGQPYFPYELGIRDAASKTSYNQSSTTLGYLNTGRRTGPNATDDWDGFGLPQTNTLAGYQGAAGKSNAGLFHFNRSFANPSELMLVPRTAPGQLSQAMTFPIAGTPVDRYSVTASNALPAPYGYLPAFFTSDVLKTRQPTPPATPRAPYWQQQDPTTRPQGSNMSSILELIETAPPFADGQQWLNPNQFVTTGNAAIDSIRTNLLADYRAPNNARSDYRTPGKINLNTISRREVWDALEWNYNQSARNNAISLSNSSGGSGPWEQWKASRRGYRLNSGNTSTPPNSDFFNSLPAAERPWAYNRFLSGDFPSQFVGAIRPSFSTNMDVANIANVNGFDMRQSRGIQSTLLRSATDNNTETLNIPAAIPSITNPPTQPTFGTLVPSPVATISPNTNTMLFSAANSGATGAAEEIASTPFTNYQRAMRLPNLTTNQSNVFAVWITIGLFEYDPEDGIGREYVGPSGVPQRSKSFYVVDRSIPVGFSPGKQYNTDKTILLRRKVSE